jgi:predicted transcriptional regulator
VTSDVAEHILLNMKQFLVELDDRCARDLERVAPARDRKRAEFIRRAIDAALERGTARAYRETPLREEVTKADLTGWDDHNELARSSAKPIVRASQRKGRGRAA